MKITAIKQQVKRNDRYSIFVDGKYSFSLSEAELLRTGLAPKQEITEAKLGELQDTARLDKAFGRVLNLVAHRARSQWEFEQYLTRKGYSPDETTVLLNKLSNYGYVDDVAFATAWVANRRQLRSASRRRLTQELRQKHIADDVIEKVLAEDETDERAVLKELVARKRRRYPDEIKLMQYLSRQGYNYDDIKAAIQEQ